MHTGTLESISFAASVGEREGSCSSESREAGSISVGERPRSPTWHHFGDEDRDEESEERSCRSEARSEESAESRVRSQTANQEKSALVIQQKQQNSSMP